MSHPEKELFWKVLVELLHDWKKGVKSELEKKLIESFGIIEKSKLGKDLAFNTFGIQSIIYLFICKNL